MIDRFLLAPLGRALAPPARALARAGVAADAVTIAGFAIGLAGAGAVALGHPLAGLALLAASRLCDGLDGAVARLTTPTDRGAFLDAALDFVFYAAVPAAFALRDPAANALPAAMLLFAFMGTASSFLAFAVLAARRGLTATDYPQKGIYYLGGLTEATETLAVFAAMCVWPAAFPTLAWIFAAACLATTIARWHWGWTLFGRHDA